MAQRVPVTWDSTAPPAPCPARSFTNTWASSSDGRACDRPLPTYSPHYYRVCRSGVGGLKVEIDARQVSRMGHLMPGPVPWGVMRARGGGLSPLTHLKGLPWVAVQRDIVLVSHQLLCNQEPVAAVSSQRREKRGWLKASEAHQQGAVQRLAPLAPRQRRRGGTTTSRTPPATRTPRLVETRGKWWRGGVWESNQ